MKRFAPLFALLAVPASACQESEGCVEVSRHEVTDPADGLFIGGTYADVLATATGERSGTLQWQPSDGVVRGFPTAGEVGLTVELHPPSMAWDIEIEKRAGRNDRLACSHQLEAEFQIDLRSEDGALDTTVLAPATIESPDSVSIYTDITDQDLGALTFDPIEQSAALRLRLSYVDGRPPDGALVLSTGPSDGDSGAGMTVELATWTLE